MPNPDPTSLRLFTRVIELGSIAAAAEAQRMAAAAVSKRISELEAYLGAPLLRRTNRGVEPTEAGKALEGLARRVLNELDQIPLRMGPYARGTRGLVRICASASAIAQFLPTSLRTFLASHSNVRVRLEDRSSHQVARLVADNAADIGILVGEPGLEGLTVFPYRTDRLTLICPAGHPLAERKEIALPEAVAFDFVGLQTDSAIDMLLTRAASAAGRPFNLAIQVTSFESLCAMVDAGLGVAVLPEAIALRSAATLDIRLVRLTDPQATRRFHLCTRPVETLSPAARLLVEHLVDGP